MARVTLVIEDLPEGDADIMQIEVRSDEQIDPSKVTPAQEMAAMVLGLIEYAREQQDDSMSEVQEKD